MQFVADENLDWPIVERLRAGGHSVIAVVELSPGISDPEVLAIANRNVAVLLTGIRTSANSSIAGSSYPPASCWYAWRALPPPT